ncbi:MAG: type II toxin-antitoxin system VapC family toxin [bacterium]|nr:type II toxin-antitoxin system VapC family toxin [bacterium]
MNIIIDTHIYLWLLSRPSKISSDRLELLEHYSNNIYFSSVSIAELMIKSSIGKIKIDFDPVFYAKEAGLELIDFTPNEALLLKDLPFFHKDPFDRMLICQSIHNNYHLMSDDMKFRDYGCKLI